MLEGLKLELGLDGFEDGVRLGELSRLQFGIYLVPIDANLESASTRRDQLQRADSLFECQKFFRQTDGFWFVVSSRAVLDCYFRTHTIFGFGKTVGKGRSNVKSSRLSNSRTHRQTKAHRHELRCRILSKVEAECLPRDYVAFTHGNELILQSTLTWG